MYLLLYFIHFVKIGFHLFLKFIFNGNNLFKYYKYLVLCEIIIFIIYILIFNLIIFYCCIKFTFLELLF
jgi:hypothetical protein